MSSQQKKKTENNKFQKSYFDVLGLCCPSEVPLIENILNSLDGVKEFSVIVPSRTVIVVHDALLISQLQIVKALNQARLEANVRAYGEKSYKKKWPSPWAVASGMLLAVSFLKYVYGPFRWLALGAVAAGLFPILSRAFASIRNFRLDINILVLIAVIGTIAMNDYTEAGTIVFLFTIAEWLESRASHKASAVMSSLMSLAPQKAFLAETGEEVDADEVKLNTILAVKAGEVIPIDGVVVDGKCEVDEKTLTGESFPVPKEKDSTVWAGTINLNGYISLKTAALAEDCVVAKMTKLVEEAQNSKSKTQRFIDKCSQYYTPAVVIISACLAVIPAALRVRDLNHWFHLALVVLVSACPCGLILSTPVATFCALTKAATSGLLIKGGDYLEILAKIKVTAFDKTGTITMGEFVVTDFQSLHEDFSVNTLLYWVSSIESKSSHPLAAALVNYAKALLVKPKPESVEDYQNFPGEGLHGKIDGNNVYIGNRKIALRAGCGTVSTMEGDAKGGKTIGYIFCGPKPAGIFSLSDACRTGVAEAIKELKSLGIRAAMLTGDNDAAAMHAQEQLGNALEVVHAELLPEDKARIINEFKKEGPTAMVGDGLNDAPALATADIGISMGISGSALATETGHVILMSNDIRKIPKAIRLARKAHRKIIENVTLSIATKVAILALAFAGHPFVWAAVLADVGTCLLVILNSMLLLGGTHKHGGKCCKSSAASNTKKHGCSTGHSHTSHENQNCCSGKNLQKACEPHKPSDQCCASKFQPNPCGPNSCGNKKCTDSFAKRHGCAGTDGCNEVKYYEYGNCIMDHKTKAHNTHNHDCSGTHSLSSCTEDKCSTAIERKGSGVSDALNGAEDCHHGRDTVTVDGPSQHLHCHADLEEGLEVKTNGGCNSDCCCDNNIESHVNNGAMRNMSGKCCGQQHPRDTEACPHKQKCGAGCSDVSHGGTDPMGTEHVAKHVCMSLKTREIGGCCRSYVKECCKHGHLGAGFGGGLTEIVTE